MDVFIKQLLIVQMFIVYSLGNKNDHLPTDKYGVFNGATKWESSKSSTGPFKLSVYVKCSGTEGELIRILGEVRH